jgi:hypothetical protein
MTNTLFKGISEKRFQRLKVGLDPIRPVILPENLL